MYNSPPCNSSGTAGVARHNMHQQELGATATFNEPLEIRPGVGGDFAKHDTIDFRCFAHVMPKYALPFPDMYLWMIDQVVFKRVGQAINQGFLYLRIDRIRTVDSGLVYGQRDLVPVRAKRSNANRFGVGPILDAYRRAVSKTKFIPLYSMSIHLELLFYDGLVSETPVCALTFKGRVVKQGSRPGNPIYHFPQKAQ